jgi:hypothetical protein
MGSRFTGRKEAVDWCFSGPKGWPGLGGKEGDSLYFAVTLGFMMAFGSLVLSYDICSKKIFASYCWSLAIDSTLFSASFLPPIFLRFFFL